MLNTEYEPTDAELLAMASQFDLYLDAEKQSLVHIVPRRHNGYSDWVAINQEKFIFSHNGGWEFQPIFAGGDDDFLYHTGWNDPRAVIAAVRRYTEQEQERQAILNTANARPVVEETQAKAAPTENDTVEEENG